MTSLAPIRPPSSASNRSTTPVAPPNGVFRHQHSLSSSTPANQHFGALSPHYGGARSAGGPRQSLDVSKALATGPISPRITSGNPMRPNSEMLGVGGQPMFGPSLEGARDLSVLLVSVLSPLPSFLSVFMTWQFNHDVLLCYSRSD